jgi:hypothetical protein
VFDLIVVSEVGYYLDAADLLLDRTVGSLAPGGVLLACHWRHPVAEYPQSGDDVHHSLGDRPELVRVVHHEETDFLLEVFTQGRRPTVAQWEGLVEPTFNSSITCNETTVHAGRPPAQAREPQMTSNTPVPIGPANSAEADSEKASVDSAEAVGEKTHPRVSLLVPFLPDAGEALPHRRPDLLLLGGCAVLCHSC